MHQRRSFFDRVRHRLFQVHIFARRQCLHCHLHVPVIRRRDEHRINVLVQHIQIVRMCRGRACVRPFFHFIDPRFIHIADRNDLVAADLVRGGQQIFHPPARADHSDPQRIVRAHGSCCRQRGHSAGNNKTATTR